MELGSSPQAKLPLKPLTASLRTLGTHRNNLLPFQAPPGTLHFITDKPKQVTKGRLQGEGEAL